MPDPDPATIAAPARWAAAGFIGGASLVGMLWTILGRAPGVVPPVPASVTQQAEPAGPVAWRSPLPDTTPESTRRTVAEQAPASPEVSRPEPAVPTPEQAAPSEPPIADPAPYATIPAPSPTQSPGQPDRLNINSASASELELLPRIGPTLAGRIIEYRETHGPIRSLTQLMEVRGIGVRTVEQLEPYIRFD